MNKRYPFLRIVFILIATSFGLSSVLYLLIGWFRPALGAFFVAAANILWMIDYPKPKSNVPSRLWITGLVLDVAALFLIGF